MAGAAQLISVQVGKPKTHPPVEPGGQQWTSGIVKTAVEGPVWVRAEGLDGDGQYDRKHHGGPGRAVNFYPSEHYEVWRAIEGLESMTGGAFGENFTTRGLFETEVCIGDVYQVGQVKVQVSQPRGPCYKLNRRWNSATLKDLSTESGRIGWYARVLVEGPVQAGLPVELLERPHPGWTVARVWSLMLDSSDKAALRELVELQALTEDWRSHFQKQL